MAVHKKDKGTYQNAKFGQGNSDKSKNAFAKNEKNVETKPPIAYYVAIIFIATSFAFFHNYHVSTLFENDRHFSHLSTLEREMTFRSEMGMYYSYYKSIVEAPSISEGFHEITHNNITEFPSTINTLERFNLFPEVTLGILYRAFDWLCDKFQITGKQCWQIERGQGLSPIHSCEGLRQPEYFYLEAVWLCAGFTASIIFLYGILLSDSIIGGLVSAMCFFYNHGESTRVQWTPPLRESFAYPFCLLQMFCVSYCLSKNQNADDGCTLNSKQKLQVMAYALPTIRERSERSSRTSDLYLESTRRASPTSRMAHENGRQYFQSPNIVRPSERQLLSGPPSPIGAGDPVDPLRSRSLSDISPSNREGAVFLTTSICLTLWQFSQFLLATQVVAILILFTFGVISRPSALIILFGQMFAVAQALLFLFGNELLLSSLLTCLLLASLSTLLFLQPIVTFNRPSFIRGFLSLIVIASLTVVLKTRTLTTQHDGHILNILRSKVSSYRDFHTLLYTCSAEFDFLGWAPIIKLSKSLLLPTVVLLILILFIQCYFDSLKLRGIEPHIAYNILQMGAFGIMAAMIMRLKLFFTPHLCIIASLLASRKLFRKIQTEYHLSVLVVLIGCMSVTGVSNLLEQHSILGEYSNIELEELLGWIMKNTPKNAVFAGPMPITAAILLSTRRPIVNHPHYEDVLLRERTKKVYSAFSRKPPEDIFKIMSSLQIEYLVLSESWCFNQNRGGCRMTDLWDLEDPENQDRPPTCPKLFMGAFPFRLVFNNDIYAVLKLQPPYVELKGFNKY